MNTRHLVACTFAILLAFADHPIQADDTIQWTPDFASAREIAQVQNRPVLLHFWSPSCVPCLRLEQEVFSKAEVGKALNEQFVAVKVNADEQSQLAEHYGVRKIPCDVVVTATGQILYKTDSPADAQTYVQKLVAAAQSPTALIARRLSQQATAASAAVAQTAVAQMATAQTAAATDPTSTTNPVANPAAGQPTTQLASQAQQTAAPWAQQLTETQQAAEQQAQAWQQGLRAQTQQLIDQSGQRVNTQLQRSVDQVAAATQPAGEAVSKTAAQVALTAQNFQSGVQQFHQQAPAAQPTATGQLEQFNPFVPGASPAAPPTTSTANSTPNVALPTQPPATQPVATRAPAAQVPSLAAQAAAAAQAAMAPPAAVPVAATSGPSAASLAPPFPAAGAAQPAVAAPPAVAVAPSIPSAPVSQPTAQQASQLAAQPIQPPKPAQPPRLGLDGFCPVTLMSENRWQQGDKRWGAVHRGRTYLFTSRKHQLEFLANPDRFAPVLAGIDPVVLTTQGQVVEGKRAHGVVYKDEVHGDQIYLFSSEESLKEFWVKPTAYAGTVRQAMVDGTVGSFLR